MKIINIRLEVAYNGDRAAAVNLIRTQATSMGVTINRVKERDDVVQLYGSKVVQ